MGRVSPRQMRRRAATMQGKDTPSQVAGVMASAVSVQEEAESEPVPNEASGVSSAGEVISARL